jgi:2-(3-amino-3-carboxypropyl)histidine synthase
LKETWQAAEINYDLEIDDVCKTIQEKAAKTILLQFPEGLKHLALKIKDEIEEKTDSEILISADPCYGACDLPPAPYNIEIDLIVQFGHSEIPNLKFSVPTIFIEAHSNLNVIPPVEKALKFLAKNVGLITTSQHIHKLREVQEFLQENGFSPKIGKSSRRITHDGQILGCNFSSATSISNDVDCYLFIGSGNFHAIGAALTTGKNVVVADPYLNEAREVKEVKEKLLRQRHGTITKAQAQEAENFGILVGTKLGQIRMELAYDMKTFIEKHGKKAYIILLREFSPMSLKPFKIDSYVSCACPRIAIDDLLMYDVPILTPQELKIALGELEWKDYNMDEII